MKPQDCINNPKTQTLPYCRCIATCTFGNRACQAGCRISASRAKDSNRVTNHVVPVHFLEKASPPPSGGWKSQDCVNPKWQKMPFCKCIAKCTHGNLACQGSCNLSTASQQSDYVGPVHAIERSLPAVKKPIIKGRKNLEKGIKLLEKNQQALEKGPGLLEKSPKTLGKGLKVLKKRPNPLKKSPNTLEKGSKPLNKGPGPLAKGQKPLSKGPKPLNKGPTHLVKGQKPLAKGAKPLAKGAKPSEKGLKPLEKGTKPAAKGPFHKIERSVQTVPKTLAKSQKGSDRTIERQRI